MALLKICDIRKVGAVDLLQVGDTVKADGVKVRGRVGVSWRCWLGAVGVGR